MNPAIHVAQFAAAWAAANNNQQHSKHTETQIPICSQRQNQINQQINPQITACISIITFIIALFIIVYHWENIKYEQEFSSEYYKMRLEKLRKK